MEEAKERGSTVSRYEEDEGVQYAVARTKASGGSRFSFLFGNSSSTVPAAPTSGAQGSSSASEPPSANSRRQRCSDTTAKEIFSKGKVNSKLFKK